MKLLQRWTAELSARVTTALRRRMEEVPWPFWEVYGFVRQRAGVLRQQNRLGVGSVARRGSGGPLRASGIFVPAGRVATAAFASFFGGFPASQVLLSPFHHKK
jgi:hypothetical protein